MNEGDAMEFFDEVVGGEDGPHAPSQETEYVLEAQNGRELTVTLKPVDRKFAIDKLNDLPDELLELFSEVEDPEEAQRQAEEAGALAGLSGSAIKAFEELCAESMSHPKLTTTHMEQVAKELDLEVLFEMGSQVVEMSLEDDGAISGFRKPGSDKNS